MIARRGAAPALAFGALALALGLALHVPMLVAAHRMGNRMAGMPHDPTMVPAMALLALGMVLVGYGILPRRRTAIAPGGLDDGLPGEMVVPEPGSTLGTAHVLLGSVLLVALVIDVMKPATLGFALPGLSLEYGIGRREAALLPLFALTGTVFGSLLWGWLADSYGRRAAIMLSTILFVTTAICGAMPHFWLNLAMCFTMGASAGGMLPVVYALLSEMMPRRVRSLVLVLVGGLGTLGGTFVASLAARWLEPDFGWRALWLIGVPTGLLLLALVRFIPESPLFLKRQGREEELEGLVGRFHLVAPGDRATTAPVAESVPRGVIAALTLAAIGWSFVNFGFLLWLPTELRLRGFAPVEASGFIARASLVALPAIVVVTWLYTRWHQRRTLVLALLTTLAGLAFTALALGGIVTPGLLLPAVALTLGGANALIAVLLPYAVEAFPVGRRGLGTGLIAGSSKLGGVAVQACVALDLLPRFDVTSLLLIVPIAAATVLLVRRTGPGR